MTTSSVMTLQKLLRLISRRLSYLAVVVLTVSSSQAAKPSIDGNELTLRFLGHASFEWITPTGTRIIIDPYDDSWWSHWFNLSFPHESADFVLVTHPHFDHDAVGKVVGYPRVLRESGITEGQGYVIRGIQARHARSEKYGDRNVIFVIEIGGIRFCHWGDNDARLTEEMQREIGRVDVLMLPIDGSEHLLTLEEVALIIGRISPRVVIPMHYFEPNFTSMCSTLLPIDNWLARQNNVRKISSGDMRLSAAELPAVPQVWVFSRFAGYPSEGSGKDSAFIPCRLQAKGPQLIVLYFVVGALLAVLVGRVNPFNWNFRSQRRLARRWTLAIATLLFWPLVLVSWAWIHSSSRSRFKT